MTTRGRGNHAAFGREETTGRRNKKKRKASLRLAQRIDKLRTLQRGCRKGRQAPSYAIRSGGVYAAAPGMLVPPVPTGPTARLRASFAFFAARAGRRSARQKEVWPGNAMGFQAERRSYPCVTPNEETARKGGYQPFGTGSPQPGPASAREPPCRQPPRMSIFLFPILPAAARKNNGQTSVRRCLSSGFFVCPPAASRASASARPI